MLIDLYQQNAILSGKIQGENIVRKFTVIIFLLFLSLSVSVNAATVDLTNKLWVVDGFDTASWLGSELVFTSQTTNGSDDLLEGFFDWKTNGVDRGRELFTGTLFNDLSLRIEGFQLINPISIQLAIYDGEVTLDGKSIINGAWTTLGGGTGVWSAAVVPVPPALWLFGSGLLGLVGTARRKKA